MNKDKRNNIQLLGTLNNADESGIIANANQVYDANEDKSTQDVSKEHKERIEILETKESSMQTTLENISKTGEASAASNVTYNHSDSKLDATNVQQAIDEVAKKEENPKQNITWINGTYINSVGVIVTDDEGKDYDTSDFFLVDPSTEYIIKNYHGSVVPYNLKKQSIVGHFTLPIDSEGKFTTLANCYYIRFCRTKNNTDFSISRDGGVIVPTKNTEGLLSEINTTNNSISEVKAQFNDEKFDLTDNAKAGYTKLDDISTENQDVVFTEPAIVSDTSYVYLKRKVYKGEKYFITSRGGETAKSLVLTDIYMNVIKSVITTDSKEMELVITEDGWLYSCGLKASYKLFYIPSREQGVVSEETVANENSIALSTFYGFKEVPMKVEFSQKYAFANNGKLIKDNRLKSEYIPAIGGKKYKIVSDNPVDCYFVKSKSRIDADEPLLSYFFLSSGNSILSAPKGAKYLCVIKYQNNDNRKINVYEGIYKYEQKREAFAISNLGQTAKLSSLGITYKGKAGAESAVYNIPISCKGIYTISFELRLPNDINSADFTRTLALINKTDNALGCNGGFEIDIIGAKTTASVVDCQVQCKSGIGYYYDIKSKENGNNYGGKYIPTGSDTKEFLGDDAFSIRFIGDTSVEANRDIVYDFNSNGLKIYHKSNGGLIWSTALPEDGTVLSLCKTLKTATDEGGELNGIIDFKYYQVETNLVSDITEVSSIPLVVYKTRQNNYDSFPSYFVYKDKRWHKVDIIFNKDGEYFYGPMVGFSGLMSFFFDGKLLYVKDVSYPLVGEGMFSDNLVLGCEGVVIRNFQYKDKVDVSFPTIIMGEQHYLQDTLGDDEEGTYKTSYKRQHELIRLFKEYGFHNVRVPKIVNYIRQGGDFLHKKIWGIIFDDYYTFRDANTNEEEQKFKNLFDGEDIRPSFAIITDQFPEDAVASVNKDKYLYDFHLHMEPYITSFSYSKLLEKMKEYRRTLRDKVYDVNIITYAHGDHDKDVTHVLYHLGFAYGSSSYFKDWVPVCGAFDVMAQPRIDLEEFPSENNFIPALKFTLRVADYIHSEV